MFRTELASCRVKRWVLWVRGFQCKMVHRRGHANIPADALGRMPLQQEAISQPSFPDALFSITTTEPNSQISFQKMAVVVSEDVELLSNAIILGQEQLKYPLLADLKADLEGSDPLSSDLNDHLFSDPAAATELQPNRLLVQIREEKRVPWLPSHLRDLVLKLCNDHLTSGYAGFFKTLKHVSGRFAWLGTRADIFQYVRCCQICQQTKCHRQKPMRLMDS